MGDILVWNIFHNFHRPIIQVRSMYLLFFEILAYLYGCLVALRNVKDTLWDAAHCAVRWFNQFLFKKDLNLLKHRFILVKKLDIKLIVYMIVLTHFSERILNPMSYTGEKYLYFFTLCLTLRRAISLAAISACPIEPFDL